MNFLKESPSTNDDAAIRKFLSNDLFVEGKKTKEGCSFIQSTLPGTKDEVTVWQTVTKPADRLFWWRIPTHGGWMEIDLKKYFTNS